MRESQDDIAAASLERLAKEYERVVAATKTPARQGEDVAANLDAPHLDAAHPVADAHDVADVPEGYAQLTNFNSENDDDDDDDTIEPADRAAEPTDGLGGDDDAAPGDASSSWVADFSSAEPLEAAQVDSIKQAMAGFQLAPPQWAARVSEDEWRSRLGGHKSSAARGPG